MSFPYVGEVTQDAVNVRAGQSTNFERLCQLNKGEEVIVLEKAYSWYKIQLPAKADVYIADKYVQKGRHNQGVVTVDKVNVRAGADIYFTVIGQVTQGQLVAIREAKVGWYKIEPMEGHVGWVSEEFIRFKSQTLPRRTLPTVVPDVPTKVSPSVDVKTEQSEIVPGAPRETPKGKTVVQGVLLPEKQGKAPDVFYRIQDGEKVYLIKGLKSALDNFLEFNVRVDGVIEETSVAGTGYPLLNVSKIQLIL